MCQARGVNKYAPAWFRSRIGHPELDDDADPDGHLIGRKDLLALDREVPLADVDQHCLHERAAEKSPVNVPGDHVPAGGEHLHQDSVLVQESAMCVLDDQLAPCHGATSAPSSRHRSFVCGSPVAVPMRSTSSPCIRVEPRAQSVLGSNPRTSCY